LDSNASRSPAIGRDEKGDKYMIWYVVLEFQELGCDLIVHRIFGEDKLAQLRPDSDCEDVEVYSLRPDGTEEREWDIEKEIFPRRYSRKPPRMC
jgi:hypothetical protein